MEDNRQKGEINMNIMETMDRLSLQQKKDFVTFLRFLQSASKTERDAFFQTCQSPEGYQKALSLFHSYLDHGYPIQEVQLD